MNLLLSAADRLSRMSAINTLVGKIADGFSPKAIAKACYGNCLMSQGSCVNHQRSAVYGFKYFRLGPDGSVIVTCVNPCTTTIPC